MMEKNRLILGGLAAATLLLAIGCGTSNTASSSTNSSHNIASGSDASLQKQYSSVKALLSDTTDVVQGQAVKTTSFTYMKVVFTDTTFKVTKVVKGSSIKPNTTITVLETGGTKNGTDVPINGVYPMKSGTEHILFLTPYVGKMPNQQYVIVGAFQGRFDIKNNGTLVAALHTSNPQDHSSVATINSVSELLSAINGSS